MAPQVEWLKTLAGPLNVRSIKARLGCLPELLEYFPKLTKLQLTVSWQDEEVAGKTQRDVVPLNSLTRLHELQSLAVIGPSRPVGRLGALQQLERLYLHDVVLDCLHPSVTKLAMSVSTGSGEYPQTRAMSRLKESLLQFAGQLRTAFVHMSIFSSNPAELQSVPCFRQVTALTLQISEIHGSQSLWWGVGAFQHLSVLHIAINRRLVLTPCWDLCSCNLSTFTLCLSLLDCHRSQLDLWKLANVRAASFQLVLEGYTMGRMTLNCSSWTLAKADVAFAQDRKPYMPQCVLDSLGSLLCTRCGTPVLRVNGLSPTAAAALAAAGAQQGQP